MTMDTGRFRRRGRRYHLRSEQVAPGGVDVLLGRGRRWRSVAGGDVVVVVVVVGAEGA